MGVQPFSFFSFALNSRRTCYVYTPPNYGDLDRSFPVVYLLHGLYGGETDWTHKGGAHETADRLIAAGRLRDVLIVMPNDGEYQQGTFYVDWYDGSGDFGLYITHDLVGQIDEHFRTIRSPAGRVTAGLSMGGYGAFVLALRNPGLFGAAASLSGALGSVTMLPERESREFARLTGPKGGAHYLAHDLETLAGRAKTADRRPALYFNCGRDDVLYWANLGFKQYLESLRFEHEFEEFEGGHTWDYWKRHVEEALLFFERCFRKELDPADPAASDSPGGESP